MDFDVVAFLQFQRLDDGGRNPNGKTIALLGDLHGETPQIYTLHQVYPKPGESEPIGLV